MQLQQAAFAGACGAEIVANQGAVSDSAEQELSWSERSSALLHLSNFYIVAKTTTNCYVYQFLGNEGMSHFSVHSKRTAQLVNPPMAPQQLQSYWSVNSCKASAEVTHLGSFRTLSV